MKKFRQFKKVILGAAMAAALSTGAIGVSAGVTSGSISIGSSGNINYTFKVYKKSCCVELSKNTSSYGLWGEIDFVEKDGTSYCKKTGKCSRGIHATFSPKRANYKQAYLKVGYNGTLVGVDGWVTP